MKSNYYCLAIFIGSLIACSEQASDNTGDSQLDNNNTTSSSSLNLDEPLAEKKPAKLDLSLPDNLTQDIKTLSEQTDVVTDEQKNTLPDLFDKQIKDKSLSVTGKPTLSMSEESGSMPEVTGGELDVKLKLP